MSRLLMSKTSIEKVHENIFLMFLDAGKLKTEQKLIVLSCVHPPSYLFWKKLGTQSHSTNFVNWRDHVNSIPDNPQPPPRPPPFPHRHSSGAFGNVLIRELPNHGANFGSLDARLVFRKFMHDMYPRVESGQPYNVTKTYWYIEDIKRWREDMNFMFEWDIVLATRT